MKITELRGKSKDELSDELSKLHLELGSLAREHRTEGLKDPGVLRGARREIARLMTVIREKEIIEEIPR